MRDVSAVIVRACLVRLAEGQSNGCVRGDLDVLLLMLFQHMSNVCVRTFILREVSVMYVDSHGDVYVHRC